MLIQSFNCSVVGFAILIVCCATSQAGEPVKKKSHDLPLGSITVHIKGELRLLKIDKPDAKRREELIYAEVEAGGTQIVLDWNDCPDIYKELSAYHMGGAYVSSVRAEVTGRMMFKSLKQIQKNLNRKHRNTKITLPLLKKVDHSEKTLVPVVVVKTILIHVEPQFQSRKRKLVTSTTTDKTSK